jgi:hypothetical protein
MLFREIAPVYSAINTLCGQSAELFNAEMCGEYSYHSVLKG